MLKKMGLFFVVLFLLPSLVSSQKIKKSEYDKFSKAYRIETNDVAVVRQFSKGLSLGLRSIDSVIFLRVSGYGSSTGVVGEGDLLIFLLSNDSTIEVRSKGIQSYTIGQYQNSFTHEYYIMLDAILTLISGNVVGIRIYNSDGYTDMEVSPENSEEINNVCMLFAQEYFSKKQQFKR